MTWAAEAVPTRTSSSCCSEEIISLIYQWTMEGGCEKNVSHRILYLSNIYSSFTTTTTTTTTTPPSRLVAAGQCPLCTLQLLSLVPPFGFVFGSYAKNLRIHSVEGRVFILASSSLQELTQWLQAIRERHSDSRVTGFQAISHAAQPSKEATATPPASTVSSIKGTASMKKKLMRPLVKVRSRSLHLLLVICCCFACCFIDAGFTRGEGGRDCRDCRVSPSRSSAVTACLP